MDTPIHHSTTQKARNSGPASIRYVGIVGVGRMGHAFMQNLLVDGHQVIAYARDSKRVRDLQFEGVQATVRLEDLASCDIIISSLPDDAALTAVALSPEGLVS